MLVLGPLAQERIRESSALVVGAGALGCSCLPYLVGAGVGKVTVCDGDRVEASNLHRQVLFAEDDIGRNKAEAAASRLQAMNSGVAVFAMPRHCMYDEWTSDLIENHSIVVDCSDNIGTRYLLNDACFLAGKVLVSAAALGTEGSLTRWGKNGGPCYRCVIHRPSPLEARRRCTDQGVLGPVPGVLGALQALDVLRYVSKHDGMMNKMHIFDGTGLKPFGLPTRRPTCELCGDAQLIQSLQDSKLWARGQGLCVDLDETQQIMPVLRGRRNLLFKLIKCLLRCNFGNLLPSKPVSLHFANEITVLDLKKIIDTAASLTLVDVRDPAQFAICKLQSAISLPLRQIIETPGCAMSFLREKTTLDSPIYVLCRRGIDSRTATAELLKLGYSNACSVVGGLDAWRSSIDPQFPSY